MYFAYWKAKKLSVVELEQFSETRQVLGYVDLICSGRDACDTPCEPSECGECAFKPGRDCVRAELRYFVQPLVQVGEMFSKDLSFQVTPDPHRSEVGAREDERCHVAPGIVAVYPDVLKSVFLLDESDGLLDAPAAEIALDYPPLRLE